MTDRLKSYRRSRFYSKRQNGRNSWKRLFQFELLEARRVLAGNGPPFVSSITRLDANPSNAATVQYQVLFDEAVTGVDSSDFVLTRTGTLAGTSIGSISGSGTTYIVAVNSGTGSGTLRLDVDDDDTIRDLSGDRLGGNGRNNGNFTTGEVYTIDKAFPTAVSLTRLDANPSSANTVRYQLQFSENVTGVDTSDFQLTTSGLTGAAISSVSGSGLAYTIDVSTGSGDGTLALNLIDNSSIRDLANNELGGTGANNGGLSGPSYTMSRSPQIVSMTRVGSNPTNASLVEFDVLFSKSVIGVDPTDFAPSTSGIVGASIAGVSGSGTLWRVQVGTGTGDGTLGLAVVGNGITDLLSNAIIVPPPASEVYTIDKTAPTVLSVVRDQTSPTNLSSVSYTITFGEAVQGIAINDFSLSSTGLTGAVLQQVTSLTSSSFRVQVSTGSGDGSLTIDVLASNLIQDIAGNALSTNVTGNPSFVVDKTSPRMLSFTAIDSTYTNAASIRYAVTWSEDVTGVDAGEFQLLTGGSVAGATITSVTGSGSNYVVTIGTGSGDGTITLWPSGVYSAPDAAGNNTVPNNFGVQGYIMDKTPPTVVSVTRDQASPTNAASVSFTVLFSENVASVTSADFQLITSGLGGAFISNTTMISPSTYQVTATTGVGSGTLSINVLAANQILDYANNALQSNATGNPAYTLDRDPPSITNVQRLDPDPTRASSVRYQVSLSEPVVQVDSSDFAVDAPTLTGTSIQSVSGSNQDYIVTVGTGTGSGNLGIRFLLGGVFDTAGNPWNTSSSVPFYHLDRNAPTVTSIIPASPGPVASSEILFDIVFSEVVSGVSANDFSVSTTGTLSGVQIIDVTGAATVYTVRVNTGTGDGTIRLNFLDDDSVIDTAGNPIGGDGIGNGNFNGLNGTIVARSIVLNGLVWDDQNGDAYQDAGEPPLSGIRVYVDSNENGQWDGASEPSQLTASNGSYEISGLPFGTHIVRAVHDSDVQQTLPATGGRGRLTLRSTSSAVGTPTLDGARAVAMRPDGRYAYVAGHVSNSLNVYEIDTDGRMSLLQTLTHSTLARTERMVISPDGNHLYVTSSLNNQVGVFSITNGQAVWLQTLSNGVNGIFGLNLASGITISPDGKNVYVAGSVVLALTRDPATGLLTYQSMAINTVNATYDLTVSPDNAYVYQTDTNLLRVFSRNTTTGALTALQTILENSAGIDSLLFARSIAVSPDSNFVYVAASTDNAITVFSRGSNGFLTKVQVLRDGDPGFTNLQGVTSIEISPDGKRLYAAGELDFTLNVFNRDLSTGRLTLLEEHKESLGSPYTTLTKIDQLALSSDGKYLLASAYDDDAVNLFESGFGFAVETAYTVSAGTPTLRTDLNFGLHDLPPVGQITYAGATPTAQTTLQFHVQLSEPVSGVDITDFGLESTGTVIASLSSVTGSGSSYTVTVNSPSGSGTLRLVLHDDDTILDGNGDPLGGTGSGTAVARSPIVQLDRTPPAIVAITNLDPLITRAASVRFLVTLSEPTTGVGETDFQLVTTGTIAGASIGSVVPSGQNYIVTVNTGTGNGSIGLNVVDDDSIVDSLGNPLGGPGTNNGGFTGSIFYFSERSPESSIRGVKWNDLDEDGIQDAGEPGLEGIRIYVDSNANGQLDLGEPNTLTGVDGSYSITGLFSGDYVVSEEQQIGWEQTYPSRSNFPVERISLSTLEAQGTSLSDLPAMNSSGRFVVFESASSFTNTNTTTAIFLVDQQLGTIERISIGLAGANPNNSAIQASISDDGRYVAYASFATNLVANDSDTVLDIFVYDRTNQTTQKLTKGIGGVAASAGSQRPQISGDGRFVVYQSDASNLVANDTNNSTDIFLTEISTGITVLISKNALGAIGNLASTAPAISDDGNIIAFESNATNLISSDSNGRSDVFVVRRDLGTLQRVSLSGSGSQVFVHSQKAALSGNGRYVGFTSFGNLVTNTTSTSTFMHLLDLQSNALEVVSLTSSNVATTALDQKPSISADGRFVSFASSAANMTLSNVADVFVRDRQLSTVKRVSRSVDGVASNGAVSAYAMSDDGKWVAFASDAKNLVANDSNYVRDVFVVDAGISYVRGSHNVSVGVSAIVSNIRFGNTLQDGSIRGTAWRDNDRDRTIDTGEPFIANRQIYIDSNQNSALDSGEPVQITDAQGNFAFDNLTFGTRTVREVLPTGWVETTPATGSYVTTLGINRNLSFDFEDRAHSNTTFVLIGDYVSQGFVFTTATSDPNQWRVYSTSSGRTSTELQAPNSQTTQTLQRIDGRPFTANSFQARSMSGASLTLTVIGEKSDGSQVSQTFTVLTSTTTITLANATDLRSLRWFTSGSGSMALDNFSISTVDWDANQQVFGSYPLPAALSGSVYQDLNQNGFRDPSDPPLANRVVYVDMNNNRVRDGNEPFATSLSDGVYRMVNIEPGTYPVRQVLLTDWTESQPRDGYLISFQPGQTLTNVVFGSYPAASEIAGTKWNDLNANGMRDAGEPGLSGWTIYIDLDNDGILDANEPSTVTQVDNPGTSEDETGRYRFTGLLPNTYSVREVAQSGWTQTSPVAYTLSTQFLYNNGYDFNGFEQHPLWDHAVSGTGRYLAFSSSLSLLPQDTNALRDIYFLDRQTNALELISITSSEALANDNSFEPSVSDDGRYVAFRSWASNFHPNDVTGTEDLFVRDRQTGDTYLITVDLNGNPSGLSKEPILSSNGRQVLFWSYASGLVSGDTNGLADLFLRDLDSNTTIRLSPNNRPINLADENVYGGDLSADGRFVAYQSFSNDIVTGDTNGTSDIFVLDRQTSIIERVSTNSNGQQANGASEKRSISDDGRFVVFDSNATNLTDDPGTSGYNIFLKDRLTGETRLISKTPSGSAANGSRRPEISSDGRWITFETTSQTLFADSANTASDIILYDRLTDRLERVTKNTNGGPGSGLSVNAVISRDGSTMVYTRDTNSLTASNGIVVATRALQFNLPSPPLANRVPLIAGQVIDGVDIGNYQRVGQISGVQFVDTNQNGIQDSGEQGLASVTVYLDANNNENLDLGELSQVTTASGAYSFNQLFPGTYNVRTLTTADWDVTSPVVQRSRIFGAFLSPDAASSTGFRAGILEFDPITGATLQSNVTTIAATSQMGLAYDGERLLLHNGANGGLYELLPNGTILDSSIVSSNSFYPGVAHVRGRTFLIESPNYWPQLVEYDAKTNQVVRRTSLTFLPDPTTGNVAAIGLGLGESADGQSLIVTSSDLTAPNRRIWTLDPDTGHFISVSTWDPTLPDDTAMTSVGSESFIGVNQSNNIRVFNASGSPLRSFATTNILHGLGGTIQLDGVATLTLLPQQSGATSHFGYRSTLGSIRGKLYEDRNRNQVQDATEPSLNGTVYLDLNDNRQWDALEPQTTTDAAGNYLFTNLSPREYVVRTLTLPGLTLAPTDSSFRMFQVNTVGGSDTIQEIDPRRGTVLRSYSSPVTSPLSSSSALAFDGDQLYYHKLGTTVVHVLSPNSGTVLRTLSIPSTNVEGLASLGGLLYLQDVANDSILVIHPLTGALLQTLDLNLLNPGFLGAGTRLELGNGLSESEDGTLLVVATVNGPKLWVHPATGLIQSSATGTFAGGTGGDGYRYEATTGFITAYLASQVRARMIQTSSGVSALGGHVSDEEGWRLQVDRSQQWTDQNLRFYDVTSPTDIVLSNASIIENAGSGTLVGLFSAVDPNVGDTHTFTLVTGTGDTDNGAFQIVGNQLRSNQVFDYSNKSTFTIRVRATDASGHTFEKPLTVAVENIPELVRPAQIGDGTAQRSLVKQVVLEFDGPIVIDPNAFGMQKRERDAGGNLVLQTVTTAWTTQNLANGNTQVVLTFSGSYVRSGTTALVDGNYQLTIDATKIRSTGFSHMLDGDANGSAGGNYQIGASAADKFFSFYGDINGDRIVSLIDYGAFRNAYGSARGEPNYNSLLDFDQDGIIGLIDYGAFRNRYGQQLDF